jgi:hypothetical protein
VVKKEQFLHDTQNVRLGNSDISEACFEASCALAKTWLKDVKLFVCHRTANKCKRKKVFMVREIERGYIIWCPTLCLRLSEATLLSDGDFRSRRGSAQMAAWYRARSDSEEAFGKDLETWFRAAAETRSLVIISGRRGQSHFSTIAFHFKLNHTV